MTSIDERVVEMTFKNSQFEKGIKQTIISLDELKESLKLDGIASNLESVKNSVSGFKLDGVAEGIETVSSKFNAFGAIGFTVLQKLTQDAMVMGQEIANFVWQPLVEGGKNRALNLEQARFQFENLNYDVQAMMTAVGNSVDGTAYSLDQAATAASNFAASGIEIGQMEHVLRAVSGSAAISGAEYSRVADIFTKVAGQGRVMGDDLNRFGAVSLNMAAEMSKQWGISEADVRKMASEGQISFQMLADAANKAFGDSAQKSNMLYSGSLANLKSAISRIGASYYDGIDPINGVTGALAQQRDLFNAIRPVVNAVHEALKPLIQAMLDASKLRIDALIKFFNSLASVDDNGIKQYGAAMLDFMEGMKSFGEGFRNIIAFLGQLRDAFSSAFSTVFTPTNTQILTNLGNGFESLTAKLKLSDKAVNVITTAFTALMAAVKFVWETIKVGGEILWNVFMLFEPIGKMIGGVVGEIFDAFNLLGETDGDGAEGVLGFFEKLSEFRDNSVEPILDFLKKLREGIAKFLESADIGAKVNTMIDWFKNLAGEIGGVQIPLSDIGTNIANFWEGIKEFFTGLKAWLEPIVKDILTFFSEVDKTMSGFFGGIKEEDMMAALNLGALAAVFVIIYKHLQNISNTVKGAIGLMSSMAGMFDSIGEAVKNFGKQTKSDAFLKIAFGIVLLAAALVALASVDPMRLLAAVGALAAVAAMLMVMVKVAEKVDEASVGKLLGLSKVLNMFASAILILSAAIFLLGQLSWDQLVVGMTGFTVALAGLVGALYVMSKFKNDIQKTSGALLVLAVGIAAMAGAVWLFAQMNPDMLVKGFLSITAALVLLVGSAVLLSYFAKEAVRGASAILVISAAIIVLAGAVFLFGSMNQAVLQQGLSVIGVLALGLTVFSFVMGQLAPNAIKAGAGILAISAALILLVPVIQMLGMMDGNQLGQGLIAIGIALLLFAASASYMEKQLAGAAGIFVISAAMLVMAVAIRTLAEVPFWNAVGGLVLLAAGLLVLVGVATLAQGLAVGFALLGAVILAIGAAFLLVGASTILFAMGIAMLGPALWSAAWGIERLGQVSETVFPQLGQMLALAGSLAVFGLGALVAGAGAIVLGVGLLMLGVGLLLIAGIGAIALKVLQTIVDGIVKMADYGVTLGLMGVAFGILGVGLGVLGVAAVLLGAGLMSMGVGLMTVSAALMLLNSIEEPTNIFNFLTGLINLIPTLLTAIGNGLVALAEVIRANAQVIVAAFLSLVNEFLIGLQETIPLLVEAGVTLLTELLLGIQSVVPTIVDTAILIITTLVEGLIVLIPYLVDAGLRLLTGILDGIANNIGNVVASATDVIVNFVTALGANGYRIVEAGGNAILEFLSGLTGYIDANYQSFVDEGVRLANAIAEGIGYGIGSIDLWSLGQSFMSGLIGGMESEAGINSPSKVAIGMMGYIADGLQIGREKNQKRVNRTGAQFAEGFVSAISSAADKASQALSDSADMSPTIRPVLDLSDITNKAKSLSTLFAQPTITPIGSYARAMDIDAEYRALVAAAQAERESTVVDNSTVINMTQNNTSPKPINTAETYRNTRNQISAAKGALANAKSG